MGGLCSRQSAENGSSMGGFQLINGYFNYASEMLYESRGMTVQLNSNGKPPPSGDGKEKVLREPFSFPRVNPKAYGMNEDDTYDGIPRLSSALPNNSISTRSKQVAVAKVSEVSTLLGRAGTVGLGKAVEVLDTLGSSMTNLNLNSGFVSGVATKGNQISILAFEVANTIVKGANLMQSLSKENMKRLRDTVLLSEGVKCLISKDMDELLKIAAADKRGEFKVFSEEVVRFGNRCKDPQWHNLHRYFEKLGSESLPQKQLIEAKAVMQQLMISVQYTADLYHELHALDRYEQDLRRKLLEDENSSIDEREVKSQRKHVKSLKKKSLWSKVLEEVVVKLVDIVQCLHFEIHEAFGNADGDGPTKNNHQRLGPTGLALHYANTITQIDTVVTRSSSVPQTMRDSLYQGLPPSVKSSLRSKLQSLQWKEELSTQQIKAEMEKTLQWLAPMATNTTRAHHGFGWVGEWANNGSEMSQKTASQGELIRIETLYHAFKEETEAYILDLVVWLQFLVKQSMAVSANCIGGINRSNIRYPFQTSNQNALFLSIDTPISSTTLTDEDKEMLNGVSTLKPRLIRSMSQEFDTTKSRLSTHHRLGRTRSYSSSTESVVPVKRPPSSRVIDFDIDRIKALDVIDRVNTM